MLISRGTIGREPLLSREALGRVLDAPGLPIRAISYEALLLTLSDLTTHCLHLTYNVVPSLKALQTAAKSFRTFQQFVEAHPTLSRALPPPPPGYLDAQGRWFTSEIDAAQLRKRGKGRTLNPVLTFAVPRLLALYAIAFHQDPHPGHASKEGDEDSRAARFIRGYVREVTGALCSAEFASAAERSYFLSSWKFPDYVQSLMRRKPLLPEPVQSASGLQLPGWAGGQLIEAWGHMELLFKQHGGQDPYRPRQAGPGHNGQ